MAFDWRAEGFGRDPIVHQEDGWYFYDETWSDLFGAYPSHELAVAALLRYCREVLGT